MGTDSYRFTLGTLQCLVAVSDGTFTHPAHMLAANAPPADLAEALRAQQLSPGAVTTPCMCLVIDTGQHRVLVDTGAGTMVPTPGHLLANLHARGIQPEEIDTVILTHGHASHISGATTVSGTPAFPNARYVMARKKWEFWTGAPSLAGMAVDDHIKHLLIAARTNLPPIRDRLDLVDGEQEIVPGIYAIPAPGHTPGHLALVISSGSEQLLYIADTVLQPFLMEHPAWSPAVDLQPDDAIATRRCILDRAAAERALTLAFHFPFPGLGHVSRRGQGWHWQQL